MPEALRFYGLSQATDHDLEDIFDYTEQKYNFDKAVDYTMQFEELFELLLGSPGIGKQRNEIKQGLISMPKGEHIVFIESFQTTSE